MKIRSYTCIVAVLALHVSFAQAQFNKKPVFRKATYQSQQITQNTVNCQPDEVLLTAEATSYCKFSKTLLYTYQLDYNNDGTFELTGQGNRVKLGMHPAYRFGTHRIEWTVTDVCGNKAIATKLVTLQKLQDSKPTAVAKLLSVELLPNTCTATLEASKVNNFSFDDCTAMNDLRLRLARMGEYHDSMTLTEVLALKDNVVFSSEAGVFSIALFVIDEANNWSFVEMPIVVQSNMNPDCVVTDLSMYLGKIEKPNLEKFHDTSTRIMIYKDAQPWNWLKVDSNGIFGFWLFPVLLNKLAFVPKNSRQFKDLDYQNVVTLTKFLNGQIALDNPYARIAADVNQDHLIDLQDLKFLKRIVDQDSSSYFSKYVFIPTSHIFTKYETEQEVVSDSIVGIGGKVKSNYYAFKLGDFSACYFHDPADRAAQPPKALEVRMSPNPFTESTKIQFDLAAAQSVECTIFDATGRQCFTRKANFQEGPNEMVLHATEFSGPGVHYCRLSTKNGNSVTKVILLSKE